MDRRSLIFLGLVGVLAFNFAIRWRLRDLPLERDEGEYAYAGQLILQGIPPYKLAYNMKFPGVYFSYAGLMAVFGETAQGVHMGMILVTSITTVLLFLIGRELIGAAGGLMAAAIFVGLAALPATFGLAGHATHFISLWVCAATLALLKANRKASRAWAAVSGVCFGLAILMKQQAAIFPMFIVAWLVIGELKRKTPEWKKLGAQVFAGGIGACLPLLVTGLGLAYAGVWHQFCFWTIQYAREYASLLPIRTAPHQFANGFQPVFDSSVLVWLFGAAGLVLILARRHLGDWKATGGALFLAGLLATCPGFYFRGHYFLVVMPGMALLNAELFLALGSKLKILRHPAWAIALPICLFCFPMGNLLARNYEFWFDASVPTATRQLYGSNPFAESVEIARYLKQNTKPSDTIAVLGSEPEIYFLAQRHSASGYIYTYAFTEPQPLAARMRHEFISEIEAARPAYVVFVNLSTSWISVIYPGTPPDHSIPDWWKGYAKNYELVGAVESRDDKPSEFFWGQDVAKHNAAASSSILIYRRLDHGSPNPASTGSPSSPAP